MTDTGDDLLWGVRAIAADINQPERKTVYMLERGLLPGGKVGARWVASRSAIAEHFRRLTSPAPPDTASEEAA